ncbi:uncharacterized protein LOC135940915 [Cloeon dipterum]|uniref:uncharacterized protein LOC135940915 n=1 Tax=Cloeon dipterum TaxID=197152 RepID=UPI0032208214
MKIFAVCIVLLSFVLWASILILGINVIRAITKRKMSTTNLLLNGLVVADIFAGHTILYNIAIAVFHNVRSKIQLDFRRFIIYCYMTSEPSLALRITTTTLLAILVCFFYFKYRSDEFSNCTQFGLGAACTAISCAFGIGFCVFIAGLLHPQIITFSPRDCIPGVMPVKQNIFSLFVLYAVVATLLGLYNHVFYKRLSRDLIEADNKFKMLLWILRLHCILWLPDLILTIVAQRTATRNFFGVAYYDLVIELNDCTSLLALSTSFTNPLMIYLFPDSHEDFGQGSPNHESVGEDGAVPSNENEIELNVV